ncbi:hypothetical protein C0J52_19408 [Blattella germanica]|nr:hypothetical protein C0J52_19408 [Blattella germanica]PSN33100.1 hypothetical protein C0J52_19408 [Blattella germanica]PSN33101.1 hypothetical protein C0J52_19408 [Blattella germanica]
MFTIEERISVVVGRLRGQTYRQVRESFERRFRKPAPTQQNIQLLVNKFMRTGSVADEQRIGRPPTSQETVETIREAIERSPHASIRRPSHELVIPRATVESVTLHFEKESVSCPDATQTGSRGLCCKKGNVLRPL